jgi:very-short-patch-repair endonuclease
VRGFVVDFYCPELMLAVELDGSAHDGIDGAARDAERSAVLAAEGIAERLTPFLGKRRWT